MQMKVIRIESGAANSNGKRRVTLRVERTEGPRSFWPDITLTDDEIGISGVALDDVIVASFGMPRLGPPVPAPKVTQ